MNSIRMELKLEFEATDVPADGGDRPDAMDLASLYVAHEPCSMLIFIVGAKERKSHSSVSTIKPLRDYFFSKWRVGGSSMCTPVLTMGSKQTTQQTAQQTTQQTTQTTLAPVIRHFMRRSNMRCILKQGETAYLRVTDSGSSLEISRSYQQNDRAFQFIMRMYTGILYDSLKDYVTISPVTNTDLVISSPGDGTAHLQAADMVKSKLEAAVANRSLRGGDEALFELRLLDSKKGVFRSTGSESGRYLYVQDDNIFIRLVPNPDTDSEAQFQLLLLTTATGRKTAPIPENRSD